jgi:hypothetical protein
MTTLLVMENEWEEPRIDIALDELRKQQGEQAELRK